MRILLVSDNYPPMTDGIATSTKTLLRGLQALGNEVTLMTPSFGRPQSGMDAQWRIPALRLPKNLGHYPLVRINQTQLKNIIGQVAPEVIHIQSLGLLGLSAATSARRAGIPRVLTWHTNLLAYCEAYPALKVIVPLLSSLWQRQNRDGLAAPGVLSTLALAIRRGDVSKYRNLQIGSVVASFNAIIVPSVTNLVQLNMVVDVPKVVVPSAVLPPTETDIRHRMSPSFLDDVLPSKEQVITFVGRVNYEKNFETLLRILRDIVLPVMPNTVLAVAGEIPYPRSIRKLLDEMQLTGSVRLLGPVPNELIPQLWARSAIHVFPSMTETQGLVLTESALSGVPSIIMDEKLNGVVKDGETGLIAPTPEIFGQSILRLLKNPSFSARLGAKAKQTALQYTFMDFASEVQKVYEQVCASA
jgi:1,2-diacylglycerol 3-alpha-glucosyltransferase